MNFWPSEFSDLPGTTEVRLRRCAFSLIELLVVIVIIAIYAYLLSINSKPNPERHNGGSNFTFADGHVITVKNREFVDNGEANRRRWNIDHEPHWEVKF